MEIINVNNDKKVKWRYEFKNKLIIFIYYLKLILTLSYIIICFVLEKFEGKCKGKKIEKKSEGK